MKTRFNTYDIVCTVSELQKLVGMRVNQVYDIDNKTFLIRFQGGENKVMLLMESGIRFHTTAYIHTKNMAPSGFSMKLRKHLKNKRLEKLEQLEMDRIVFFQFGTGEASYHIILELYDRGNIILTDHELTILNILRPHYEGDSVRFAVKEQYPTNRAKKPYDMINDEKLKELLFTSPANTNLRRVLMQVLDCGPAVIDHVLKEYNLDLCVLKNSNNCDEEVDDQTITNMQKKIKKNKKNAEEYKPRYFDMVKDFKNIVDAIKEAHNLLMNAQNITSKGYIIQNEELKPNQTGDKNEKLYQYIEYHPYLFSQYKNKSIVSFDTFMHAVDEFYSKLEEQKIDIKTLQQEREAIKKLTNVKEDHLKRLEELNKAQQGDKRNAELITTNQELVDNAIKIIRSALANQMSWTHIQELVKAAQMNGDPIACSIKQLKLEVNYISLILSDPYELNETNNVTTFVVDIDLSLSAWANARKYYDLKRTAAQKEQKTIDSSQKALKSAEKKTQQTLKDVRTISKITKARKVYWFEKFYWFISSENYLIIGGRDAQQNELIVKRYMRPTDVYVHAEIQGASSIVIRNPTAENVPPKTLLEAGTMAISYSVAWDAKVVTNAYWVRSEQVTKKAPTGEYLGTGSFMIRGKKNFLPSCHLVMGLSLLFKLEDSFIERHQGERKVRSFEEEQQHRITELIEHVNISNDKLEVLSEEGEELDNGDINNTENTPSDNNIVIKELLTKMNAIHFPDTQVKIEHDTGIITVRSDSNVDDTNLCVVNEFNVATTGADEATIIPAAPSKKKSQKNKKKRKEEKENQTKLEITQQKKIELEAQVKNFSEIKRGQKGKYKKMKLKYRDQDEEERELRMQILKSSGKEISVEKVEIIESLNTVSKNPMKSKKQQEVAEQLQQLDAEDAEDMSTIADVAMLDSLTGQPLEGDELLFVIPVVAPYQALQNYKFKVKLTPGTGRRGRAAKTALSMFASDKNCSLREKDLLKSIKDEALARNIPGKVKISAPQLQKYKK